MSETSKVQPVTPPNPLGELLDASAAMDGGKRDMTETPNVWYEESQKAIITIANEIASKLDVNSSTEPEKVELCIQQYVDWLGHTVKELAMAQLTERMKQ